MLLLRLLEVLLKLLLFLLEVVLLPHVSAAYICSSSRHGGDWARAQRAHTPTDKGSIDGEQSVTGTARQASDV
jgi:hypothetical protein